MKETICRLKILEAGIDIGAEEVHYRDSLGIHSKDDPKPPVIPYSSDWPVIFGKIRGVEVSCGCKLPKTLAKIVETEKRLERDEVTPAEMASIRETLKEELGQC
ncbi:MAG: hypothetical protein PHQ43_05505 [Dehalococcoidales bacterium]|nr:hypothetical protein [Dehalococcoidales bacterium]